MSESGRNQSAEGPTNVPSHQPITSLPACEQPERQKHNCFSVSSASGQLSPWSQRVCLCQCLSSRELFCFPGGHLTKPVSVLGGHLRGRVLASREKMPEARDDVDRPTCQVSWHKKKNYQAPKSIGDLTTVTVFPLMRVWV